MKKLLLIVLITTPSVLKPLHSAVIRNNTPHVLNYAIGTTQTLCACSHKGLCPGSYEGPIRGEIQPNQTANVDLPKHCGSAKWDKIEVSQRDWPFTGDIAYPDTVQRIFIDINPWEKDGKPRIQITGHYPTPLQTTKHFCGASQSEHPEGCQ